MISIAGIIGTGLFVGSDAYYRNGKTKCYHRINFLMATAPPTKSTTIRTTVWKPFVAVALS